MKRSINEIESMLRRVKDNLNSVYGNRIKRVMVYGSFAKGEADEESDVDIAVVVDDTYKSPLILNIKEEGVPV